MDKPRALKGALGLKGGVYIEELLLENPVTSVKIVSYTLLRGVRIKKA